MGPISKGATLHKARKAWQGQTRACLAEWAKEARVLHYTRLEGLARDKHSSLLVSFISV